MSSPLFNPAEKEIMRPVPVKLADYVHNLVIDASTSADEKQMRIEVLGMIVIMERNLAVIYPTAFSKGKIIWEIRYPRGSLFFNGPKHPSAWGAMVRNYTHNGKFKKILAIEGGKGDLVLDFKKITDDAVANQRKAHSAAQGEGGLDMADFKKLKES